MTQRIVLSRAQVKKLRQFRGEVDLAPDGDVPQRILPYRRRPMTG
jgi:hypothetical protein